MRAPAKWPLGAVLIVALFSATFVRAGEVVDAQPRMDGGWLVLDLQLGALLDARTRSTIESGLPGSCLLEIELVDHDGEVSSVRRLERSLEVDLWEDLVRMLEQGRETQFASLAAADSAWAIWSSIPLAPESALDKRSSYSLRIAVEVRPLGSEERDRVSRWVSQSDRDGRRDMSIDMGGLVRRFFGSSDDEDVAAWRGPQFTIEQLKTEARK